MALVEHDHGIDDIRAQLAQNGAFTLGTLQILRLLCESLSRASYGNVGIGVRAGKMRIQWADMEPAMKINLTV